MFAPRVAVMTMVRNESIFLDIWIRHYRIQLPSAELFVFDHLSDDGSVERASARHEFTVTRETHPAYDDFGWYTRRIEEHQRRLLAEFDIVVFAESDELLWHPRGLAAYVADLSLPAVRCSGYQIIQRPDEEPIDLQRPLLEQRSTWFRRSTFDKALVSTIPLRYSAGFHRVEPEVDRDPELLLVHLHTIDRQWAHDKNRRTCAYGDYDDTTRNLQLGWHNRVLDTEFDVWWNDLESDHEMEEIAPEIRMATDF